MKRKREEERKIIPVIGDSTVYVGRGLLESIPAELVANKNLKASKFVIVTDDNIWPLYGQRLVDAFLALPAAEGSFKMAECLKPPPKSKPGALCAPFAIGCNCGNIHDDFDAGSEKILLTYKVPHGEDSKSRGVKDAIEDYMIMHRCGRDTCMLALGGGVVGDLVGYVAATYMRGVPYVQIPTSSTAMIDSSVGGKTAINVPGGKNLIGAFHQPVMVYADLDLLATLGKRELVEGIAEAIKMGCIRYLPLFEMLEKDPERVMGLDDELISGVIYESVRLKAEVVKLDEKEGGLRSTLNWGHTVGHAIEALKSPAMMHGECVAIGCVVETELSLRMGNADLTPEKIKRVTDCFASYGLPIHIPPDCDMSMLMKKMSMDKKNQGNSIRCTIVPDIGVSLTNPQPVDKELMKTVMAESIAECAKHPAWTPHKGRVAVKAAGGQMAA